MRRSLALILGLAAACGFAVALSFETGAEVPCVPVAVGIDLFPLIFQANQPSSIGDFKGHVGYALFSAEGGSGDNWSHFEADMRFERGKALDTCGAPHHGQWGLT